MLTSAEIRAKIAELHGANEALVTAARTENRQRLTDDETRQFDQREADITALEADLRRAEALEERTRRLNGAQGQGIRPEVPGSGGSVPARPEDGGVTDFRTFGEFLFAVRFRPSDQRLASLYVERDTGSEERAQSMGEGAEGGFAVPATFRDGLMEVQQQGAIFRPRATVIPAGSPPDGKVDMVALDQGTARNMYGGVVVDWIGEGDEKPETDYRVRQVSLQPHEVAAHVVLTDKLLRNWAAAGPVTDRLLRGAMVAAEDAAFFSGDGTGKPLGVRDAGATFAVNRTNAGTITSADVRAMYARAKFGGRLVWIASQSTLPALMALKDENNGLIWQPNARDGAPGTLMGLPVVMSERSALVGAKGDLMLCDLGYYLIKDGSGPFVAASEHALFKSNKTIIKAFWNVDGQPWLTAPIRQENGYDVSPFVALDVPS